MKFDVYLPCAQLLPYVKHFIISENDHASTYTVFPDTALVMGFQYKGGLSYQNKAQEHKLSNAGITGLRDEYRNFSNTAGTGTVLVILRENGAANLLATPLHEIFGESLSLDNFFDRTELSDYFEKLYLAPDDAFRIKLTEDFLIARLSVRKVDPLVDMALEHIHASGGTIRISKLAEMLNTSASPLEKRFRQEVGASPKKFATIVRARNILMAMQQGKTAYAEHLLAYYDQAHFIKEFKKFASVTPEQYLKQLK